MSFTLIRDSLNKRKKRPLLHIVPVIIKLFRRFERNTSYPPIQLLQEALQEHNISFHYEFKGNLIQLILFFLWLARFSRVSMKLAKIFFNMCARLKIYRVPEYNCVAVWMFILTGYMGIDHSGNAKRMIKACNHREMLAMIVYALDRLGNLVSNNFFHHYFYKGDFDEALYETFARSYTKNFKFSQKMYSFIKRKYIGRGLTERLRETTQREALFQTLPTLCEENFRSYLNSFTYVRPVKLLPRRVSSNDMISRKKVRFVLPHKMHPPRIGKKPFIGYIQKYYDPIIPNFIYMWSTPEEDDIQLDINAIEAKERLLRGDVSSVTSYSTDDRLILYEQKLKLKPNVLLRKPQVIQEQRVELNSVYRPMVKGKRSVYCSKLYIKPKKLFRKSLKKIVPTKNLRDNKRKKIEKLVIKRTNIPLPSYLRTDLDERDRDKPIIIKKNLATVLREAATFLKEEKKEHEKLKQIVEGAPSTIPHEQLLKSMRLDDERKRKKRLIAGRLKAQLVRQTLMLGRERALHRARGIRKRFEDEREQYIHQYKANMRRDHRRRERLKKKVLKVRRRIIAKQKLLFRKRNLEAAALAWENYTMSCIAYDKTRKEYKRKCRAIKTGNFLKKVARIQKREIKPMEDIEHEERKKIEEKWTLIEQLYKRYVVRETRAFNVTIRKFATKYIVVRKKRRMQNKHVKNGKRTSILSNNVVEESFNEPLKSAFECGHAILSTFKHQLNEFKGLKTLVVMREKINTIKYITTRLNKCLTKLTGVRLQNNLTALEKASVNVKFTIELEKAKAACEWYPAYLRGRSMRTCRRILEGYYDEFDPYGEDYEGYESVLSADWDLIEMEEKKLDEKQSMLEEQAMYICDIIGAIQVFFKKFVTPVKKKPPVIDEVDTEIAILQERMNQMKCTIMRLRQDLDKPIYSKYSETGKEKASAAPTLHFTRFKFEEAPVLLNAQKKIKFIKLKEKRKPASSDQRISDASLADHLSEVSLQSFALLAEIRDLSRKRKNYDIRGRQKQFSGKVEKTEAKLTTEEEEYLKTQPPGFKLYTNQWGNTVYELKLKNEFKYIWEWVPIAIPKSAEKPAYPVVTKAPNTLEEESVDSNDSALLLATKEHNAKYYPIDLLDKPFIESKWKKRQQEFSHLPKEVRKRYLKSVQKFVWDYYRNHPKGGRPEKLVVHIPLGDIEQEYLYFINKQKTKTSKRLKEKLHDIEKQLGILANNKVKTGRPDRKRRTKN
ncbi:uncharacterized protein [Halyomorpha halys]|uniref:uncharacterized protein n=1 Tax=Halyomorpha halys TaxID=286706 RepID=UPI0006D4F189|nr:uncharacterized protein LOC106681673 [Halyomorpha halys]